MVNQYDIYGQSLASIILSSLFVSKKLHDSTSFVELQFNIAPVGNNEQPIDMIKIQKKGTESILYCDLGLLGAWSLSAATLAPHTDVAVT